VEELVSLLKSVGPGFASWASWLIPLITIASLIKWFFGLKNTLADTKQKEIETKLKELDLADRQKQTEMQSTVALVSDYPKFEPISAKTWNRFLGATALNGLIFLAVMFTQPLSMFSIGTMIVSILAAWLSFAFPILATVTRRISYSTEAQTWVAIRFTLANASLFKTQAALAKGQLDFTDALLAEQLGKIRQTVDYLGKAIKEVDVHKLNQPIPGLLDKFQQSLAETEAHLQTLRDRMEKIKLSP
jgi:hypothetical protein